MTQKEIKEQIAYDEERLEEALHGYKYNPEHKKIQEELDELAERKALLERRKYEIQVDYRKEAEDDIAFAREELKYSKGLLDKIKNGLNPKDYNDELVKMYLAFYSGSTYGYKKKLHWVSEDGNYAVFKIDSHSAYVDRMTGSVSAEAVWCLFVIDPEFNNENGRVRLEPSHELCIWHKEGGRWGAKRDMVLVEEAINNFENNTFMTQFMENNGFELIKSHHSSPKWVHKDIVIKYQTKRTPGHGFNAGKEIVEDHERELVLYMKSNDYYVNMPKNFEELEKKYPQFIKELKENR